MRRTKIESKDPETPSIPQEVTLATDFLEWSLNPKFLLQARYCFGDLMVGLNGIDGRRFIHDPSLYIGHYSEIESILEIQEPGLYKRKDKDFISNSLLSSSSETLFQMERAHWMDPDMVPALLWKPGNLYNPKSDEVSLNVLPNLPEDAILIDEIPRFGKGKDNDIGSILLEKVEGSDLNEDQKEDLLNLVSLYQDIFIKGIEGLPQTPLLEFRVELND